MRCRGLAGRGKSRFRFIRHILLHGRLLHGGGDEAVIDKQYLRELPLAVSFYQTARESRSLVVACVGDDVVVVSLRRESGLLEGIGALAPYGEKDKRSILLPQFQRGTDDVGVESSAEGGIGRDDNRSHRRVGSSGTFLLADRTHRREYLLKGVGVRTHPLDDLLRLAQLGGRDELHRRSYLERAAY